MFAERSHTGPFTRYREFFSGNFFKLPIISLQAAPFRLLLLSLAGVCMEGPPSLPGRRGRGLGCTILLLLPTASRIDAGVSPLRIE